MTSREFTIWLKGVIVGAAKFQPTSEQWAAIREQVELIDDNHPKINLASTGTISFASYPNTTISHTNLPSGSNINYTTL